MFSSFYEFALTEAILYYFYKGVLSFQPSKLSWHLEFKTKPKTPAELQSGKEKDKKKKQSH